MSTINHTGIPTAHIFGDKGYTWNPIKGCNNKSCYLHPVNTGKCWAAKMCNRMAIPWAESEADFKCGKSNAANNIQYPNDGYPGWKKVYDNIYEKLKTFKPTWLESQYQKKFPKKRSCILVGYMTDIAFVPREWVQKIIDKIKANNEEREKAGLPLNIFPFLTKDPSVYAKFKWPTNCWLGVTIMRNFDYNNFIHFRFKDGNQENIFYLYMEPLIEPIDFRNWNPRHNEFDNKLWDWIIVGGGPEPLKPDWVRSIRDQCIKAGIPFYFKSWGKWIHPSQDYPPDFSICKDKTVKSNYRKKKSKPILDGLPWEQFPEVE